MPKCQIAPNKTLIVEGVEYPIHSFDIPQNWHSAAKAKGYRIAARIHDRLHVALYCQHCGGLTKVRTNVLLSF